MYESTRKDDANDWCPHEHRRDLRGLYVIGSLVNHYDLKDHNTMDVYIGEDGSGHLKHYLMDFGSTFGSDGQNVKNSRKGYANTFDLRDVGVSTITFGLKTWAWQNSKPPTYPSIGYFESELFEPDKFDPINPNTAFEQLTYQDAYWGAKIVMAFTDEDLAALLETGHYSDPESAAYLLKTLIERRNKIGRHWFGKINPLDFPSVENSSVGVDINFQDLAVEYGLVPNSATYQYEIRHKGRRIIGPKENTTTKITLTGADLMTMLTAGDSELATDEHQFLFELRIRTARNASKWSKSVIFWLYYKPNGKQFSVVGIEHPG